MAQDENNKWRKEFGLEDRRPPEFVSNREEFEASAASIPQAHVVRRAFDQLGIDGVLSIENAPVIYFKGTQELDAGAEARLLKLFWNQGVAPILVLIDPQDVRVYSGLVPPDEGQAVPSAVETLSRAGKALPAFTRSVESGQYFQRHSRSFDQAKRVDRELLRNLTAARTKLMEVEGRALDAETVDALLCRLVFTCYLFDRGVIDAKYLNERGIEGAAHLTDILGRSSAVKAKTELYALFERLSEDFNGDLFAGDFASERKQLAAAHIGIVNGFFRGRSDSGQRTLWGYDFSVIPIETISAIYERFLKASDPLEKQRSGAFYTPRFLAEFVIDRALVGYGSLLDKRFLDPACGSGIFLVGLFNRLAEEWRFKHTEAKYDRTATGLQQILRTNLFGIDRNPVACKIAAFSLYLAFLDQLSPPDIRQLQRKGKFLPRLVASPDSDQHPDEEPRTIRCADFFDAKPDIFTGSSARPPKAHVVIGNPPWASAIETQSPAAGWCKAQGKEVPDRQLANAFAWKAPEHLEEGGKVCFLLPHGFLFKHSSAALKFQKSFFKSHQVDEVVNLADYRMFLFAESKHAALVLTYRKNAPTSAKHRLNHMAPKADWSATRADVISVLPQDRGQVGLAEVLQNLADENGALIWKRLMWATGRDRQLLERLSVLPRLREVVGQPGGDVPKRWLIAEGFQPLGKNDDAARAKKLSLPSRKFIRTTANAIDLFLLPEECEELSSNDMRLRSRSNTCVEPFRAPHVLVGKGFSRIAFADFDVSFQHALRGIHGPDEDADLLMFLAAYLRSRLARYFLFHTSSNWGVSRPEVHVNELLRLPFVLPEDKPKSAQGRRILRSIKSIVERAMREIDRPLRHKQDLVDKASADIEPLIEEYFDVDEVERMLIADTLEIIEPSKQPTQAMSHVHTITPSTQQMRDAYGALLCRVLNEWAEKGWTVHCRTVTSSTLGLSAAILEKTRSAEQPTGLNASTDDLLIEARKIARAASTPIGSLELVRGVKFVHRNRIFLFKPLGQRFWSQTAALNDADEIAATIFMQSLRRDA